MKPIRWISRILCECAPLYEPHWWNDGGKKQLNNNCYNYSTNYRTDTFAQPGQAAGIDISNSYYCPTVRPAAVADDLLNTPNAHNKCSKEGHLVTLVVAPGIDYHWYRKVRNGHWTHKPGGAQLNSNPLPTSTYVASIEPGTLKELWRTVLLNINLTCVDLNSEYNLWFGNVNRVM